MCLVSGRGGWRKDHERIDQGEGEGVDEAKFGNKRVKQRDAPRGIGIIKRLLRRGMQCGGFPPLPLLRNRLPKCGEPANDSLRPFAMRLSREKSCIRGRDSDG